MVPVGLQELYCQELGLRKMKMATWVLRNEGQHQDLRFVVRWRLYYLMAG